LTTRGHIYEYEAADRKAPMIRTLNFEPYEDAISRGLDELTAERVIRRIWAKD